MRLLTRYILVELLKVFLVTLAVMTIFMEVVFVGKEAYQQGLGLKQILLLLPYITPSALQFAVPGTILFAACSVYGRLSSSNEVVALKSLGISPWAILWPGFALSFVLSLGAVWLNDLAVSWGTTGVRRVIVDSVEEIVYSSLLTKKAYGTKQFSMNVMSVEGRKLRRLVLTIRDEEGNPTTISASEAELRTDRENNSLVIRLNRPELTSSGAMADGFGIRAAEVWEYPISLDEASRKGVSLSAASQMPLRELEKEYARTSNAVVATQQRLATQAAYQLLMGDFPALAQPNWEADLAQLDAANYRFHRTSVEPFRRWAAGFSCLAFVLVGAPLAIRLRNSDFTTSFFLCFLPVLLFYYPLLIVGTDQAKTGAIPPQFIWGGNAVFAFVSLFIMRKVWRY